MFNYQAQVFNGIPMVNLHSMDLPASYTTNNLTNHGTIAHPTLTATSNPTNTNTNTSYTNIQDSFITPALSSQTTEEMSPIRIFTPLTDVSDTDFSSTGEPPIFHKKHEQSPPHDLWLIPNKNLEREYRTFIKQKGFMAFLNKYIPESMTKKDICKMIIDFGYPQELLQHHNILTINEALSILVDLIINDETINSQLPIDIEESEDELYTIQDFRQDLVQSSKVLIITGAGISTSLGIPDFRSFQGVYSQLSTNLSEPQKVFDKYTFIKDPTLFYSNAHLVLPPEGKFSVLHAFIKLIQDKEKLLRNYTQNIDNLETKAGISSAKLIQCHGSFAEATCITCKNKFIGTKIFDHIRHQQVPRCSTCWESIREAQMNHGVIKPDIIFFGEDLPKKFYRNLSNDIRACDLVLVIGTSLKVEPVASIIDKVPRRVPRILINKDPLPDRDFDLSLIGYCDDIVSYLVQGMGRTWDIPHESFNNQQQFNVVADGNRPDIIRISKVI